RRRCARCALLCALSPPLPAAISRSEALVPETPATSPSPVLSGLSRPCVAALCRVARRGGRGMPPGGQGENAVCTTYPCREGRAKMPFVLPSMLPRLSSPFSHFFLPSLLFFQGCVI